MAIRVRIAVVGDFDPTLESHTSNSSALRLAALAVGANLESNWLATPSLAGPDAPETVASYDGFWLTPGEPYLSRAGALAAIRFARERDRPLLGTCRGFQNVALEYAHNVLGLTDLEHAEEHPEAERLLLTPVACAVPQGEPGAATSGDASIRIVPRTLAAAFYGRGEVQEECFCNFGLNPEFVPALEAGGLRFSGFGESGEARILELPGHRYFFGTLFHPERSAKTHRAHAVITEFVRAAQSMAEARAAGTA